MAEDNKSSLDSLTALCKRRGFIYHSSEIYGGMPGFWDYGPLGCELKNNVNQFVTVHSLNALKAAGRVKASSAFFGNLLGVKPILVSDKNGDNIAIKKVKGRLNSLEEIVNLTVDGIIPGDNEFIYVVHADCEDEAKEVEKLLNEKLPDVKVEIGYIGPIIGASIGADAIGIFSWGKSCERFTV